MQAVEAYSATARPVQITSNPLEAAMASATASHAPKDAGLAPVTREQYQAARADLEARARAGKTVQGRNSKGQFLHGVKVSTFGTDNVVPFRRPANDAAAAQVEEPRATKADALFELAAAAMLSLPLRTRLRMSKHLLGVMQGTGADDRSAVRRDAAKIARTIVLQAEQLTTDAV